MGNEISALLPALSQPSSDLGQPVNIPTPSGVPKPFNVELPAPSATPLVLPTKVNFKPPLSHKLSRHRHCTHLAQKVVIRHGPKGRATPWITSFHHDVKRPASDTYT